MGFLFCRKQMKGLKNSDNFIVLSWVCRAQSSVSAESTCGPQSRLARVKQPSLVPGLPSCLVASLVTWPRVPCLPGLCDFPDAKTFLTPWLPRCNDLPANVASQSFKVITTHYFNTWAVFAGAACADLIVPLGTWCHWLIGQRKLMLN